MKGMLLVLFVGLVISCQYDSIADSSTLAGKWNVLSDFSYEGVGLNNHAVSYSGLSGDYFIFGNNNLLYTKEGNTLDTLNYQFLSDSVSIASNIYQMENISWHSITLYWPGLLTPGGRFSRKIVLTR